ncbi:TonB-dependent receptor [Alteromonas macleodii]|uniref:TonB-dependent receptor n=1 Tax=Alteromonas macleodii TaxID=28108 RepID=UPI000689ABFC|nr:TonB-dependent receptor [Alteromonas macleodii]
MEKQKYRKSFLTCSILLAFGTPLPTIAVEQGSSESEEVELIEVKGFRSSIIKGQELKRNAVGSQDSIVASDIADFPNVNLAESLQRIPGVTITRDNGEGRQIALRGLGADFTRSQLNGMEALATNASILDSRGSVSRTRSFDYNIFASELFNQVDVYKSYEAKQDEGGIAGTVNLKTPKPFDYSGFKGAFSAKASYNDASEKSNPRLAMLLSNRWDNFGATMSLAHTKADSVEFGHRNWQWEPFTASGYTNNLTESDIEKLENENLAYPVANTISTVSNKQERTGLTTTFQWRPNDSILLSTDLIFAKLKSDASEFNSAVRGGRTVNDYEIRGESLVYGEYVDADIRNEAKLNQSETEFKQFTLEADVYINSDLHMLSSVGYSKSVFDAPVHDKVYVIAKDHTVSFDYRNNPEGSNSYDFDIADSSFYQLHRADTREDYISNEFATFKTDFSYYVNDLSSLEFGIQLKSYESYGFERRQTLRNLEDSGINFTVGPVDQAVNRVFAVANVASSIPNVVAAGLNARNTDRLFTRDLTRLDNIEGSEYTVTEDTTALYAQYSIELDDIRANFGIRHVNTDVNSQGEALIRNDGEPNRFEDVSFDSTYSEWLPAFNFAMDLSDELVFRFSANRNLSRPSLSALQASTNIGFAGGTITMGNPELQPFIADSFELGLEYYFSEVGYVALSLYSKDMVSFIVTESESVLYENTGLPENLLPPGDEGRTFIVSRPVNGNGASLTGAELAAQYEFNNGLGLIGNITYSESDAEHEINGENVSADLLGLSRVSYNLTAYYETDTWGARISQAYRDEYLPQVAGRLSDFVGVQSTSFVDASIYYNLSENLKISLEGINLTNEKLYQFEDLNERRSRTVYESGRNFLLGVNYSF